MLKLEVNGAKTKLCYHGDLEGLCGDMLLTIHHLYRSLMEREPRAAEAFRHMMVVAAVDKDSPLWNASNNGTEGTSIVVLTPKDGEEP